MTPIGSKNAYALVITVVVLALVALLVYTLV